MAFLLRESKVRSDKRDRFACSIEERRPSVTIKTLVVVGAAVGGEKHRLGTGYTGAGGRVVNNGGVKALRATPRPGYNRQHGTDPLVSKLKGKPASITIVTFSTL